MGTHKNGPIAITGMGILMPGANSPAEFWDVLHRGEPQIAQVCDNDVPNQMEGLIDYAARLTDIDCHAELPGLPEKHAAKYGRGILAPMVSTRRAIVDSRLPADLVESNRTSIIHSSSRGPAGFYADMRDQSPPATDIGLALQSLPGAAATMTSIYFGAQGIVTTISNACVGGHHALALAMGVLRDYEADAVLVTGYEFPLTPMVAATLAALGPGVLSRGAPVPQNAVRPYSSTRNGFALGEGSITLVLERAVDAKARGARVYAELLCHVGENEASHPTRMDLTGNRQADLMWRLLRKMDFVPSDLGYVAGHGTATWANDLAECRTMRRLVGGNDMDLPPVGSNKSVFGHTLGLAGIVNCAAIGMMLHHQILPKTPNVIDPEPECDIDHVAEGPRPVEINLAASMSFALGSQTSFMLLRSGR